MTSLRRISAMVTEILMCQRSIADELGDRFEDEEAMTIGFEAVVVEVRGVLVRER